MTAAVFALIIPHDASLGVLTILTSQQGWVGSQSRRYPGFDVPVDMDTCSSPVGKCKHASDPSAESDPASIYVTHNCMRPEMQRRCCRGETWIVVWCRWGHLGLRVWLRL